MGAASGQELLGLLQRAADEEDEGDDHAADEEGDPPPPGGDFRLGEEDVELVADDGRHDDGHLLARRLPADVEPLAAGGGHFGEVDRDAAELDPGREALEEAADEDAEGGEDADGRVARDEGDHHGPERHQGEGDDESLAAPDPVDVGAENDGPEGAHEEACPEGDEGEHQRGELAPRGEKGLGDVGGVEAEEEEVEHLQEVTAGYPKHGP